MLLHAAERVLLDALIVVLPMDNRAVVKTGVHQESRTGCFLY